MRRTLPGGQRNAPPLWIWTLITVFIDIFRSHDLSGTTKALWFPFVLLFPLIGVIVYLVVRGGSMHHRSIWQFQPRDFGPGSDFPTTAAGPPPSRADQPAGLASYRAEIDQATGMLTEQLGVGVTAAFARLRAYAYVNDLQLAGVARDIVARRLRLSADPDLSLRDET